MIETTGWYAGGKPEDEAAPDVHLIAEGQRRDLELLKGRGRFLLNVIVDTRVKAAILREFALWIERKFPSWTVPKND